MRHALPFAALLLAATAQANDSSYAGCSGTLSPVSAKGTNGATNAEIDCVPIAEKDVALVDEVLDIDLTSRRAKVTARYTFKHTGAAATALTVGFPVERPFGEQYNAERTANPFPDYAVTVDGAASPFTLFVPGAHGSEDAKAAAKRFDYQAVYLTDVRFDPGQTRVIEHRYTTGPSLIAYDFTPFRYILRTGAQWKSGTIGKIAIRVRVTEPVAPRCLGASLPAMRWDAATRSFVFEAENWEPTQDLHVTYSPGMLWLSIEMGGHDVLPGIEAIDAMDDARLETALKGVVPKVLAETYSSFLGWLSAESALPKSSKSAKKRSSTPEEGCSESVPALPSVADPTLRLAELEPWMRRFLVAADKVLTQRKIAHPALPAP